MDVKKVIIIVSIIVGIPLFIGIQIILGLCIDMIFFGLITSIYFVLCFVLDISLFIAGIKIIIQIERKQKVFDCFNKPEQVDIMDVMISSVNKLPYKQKIKRCSNGIIVKNIAGTFIIKFLSHKGTLTGNINDKYWLLNNKKILNPFTEQGRFILLRNPYISYNIYGLEIYEISQIIFKIENAILNVKSK